VGLVVYWFGGLLVYSWYFAVLVLGCFFPVIANKSMASAVENHTLHLLPRAFPDAV
jgi:hypothetical protein